jgi:GTP-binding protein HflX
MQPQARSLPNGGERAILVGVEKNGDSPAIVADSLDELASLVGTAGGVAVHTVVQKLDHPHAATYIGKGKAEEIAALCKADDISLVVFDDELSPAQNRNLNDTIERKVIDRTQLILDIFARRAQTKEGKLQIALAQLKYLLPRLTRMWSHLSRQSGGIGTRGDGETQLEVDRRRAGEKIAKIKRDLDEVRQHRATQRQSRERHNWPVVSLVGYTNAGKSTLFNRLTHAEVLAEDKLFATLDPTTRLVNLPPSDKQRILLTDTVGFIKKLPHDLVESFKATLEEVRQADLLFHIVDLSHPGYEQQIAAVNEVLGQIGCEDKPVVLVFNKADQVDPEAVQRVLAVHPASVAVSAKSGEGIESLLLEAARRVASRRVHVDLVVPNHETALLAELHRVGNVIEIEYDGDHARITASLPPALKGRLELYIVPAHEQRGRGDGNGDNNGDGRAANPGTPRKRATSRAAAAPRTVRA